jgi:hypothetical protein
MERAEVVESGGKLVVTNPSPYVVADVVGSENPAG